MNNQAIKANPLISISEVRRTSRHEVLVGKLRSIEDVRGVYVDQADIVRVHFHSTTSELLIFPNGMVGGSAALLRTTLRRLLDALDATDAQFRR
jgi:hypothetical protein